MSDIKRYGHISYLVEATPKIVQLYPEMTIYVLAEDYNAAQSELTALREENERLKSESFEELYNAAIDERDAMREELATAKRNEHNSEVAYRAAIERQEELRNELGECKGEYDRAVNRLTAAEQRNEELTRDLGLARDKIVSGLMLLRCDDQFIQKETAFIDAALKPTESGASE